MFHLPSATNFLGDFGEEKVFLLQDVLLAEQPFHPDSFTASAHSSGLPQTGISPTGSQHLNENLFINEKNNLNGDEFSYIVIDSSDVQTGFDIYMDDTRNVPESVYPVEVKDAEPAPYGIKVSVIVKNHYAEVYYKENSNIDKCVQNVQEKNDIEALVEECFMQIRKEN